MEKLNPILNFFSNKKSEKKIEKNSNDVIDNISNIETLGKYDNTVNELITSSNNGLWNVSSISKKNTININLTLFVNFKNNLNDYNDILSDNNELYKLKKNMIDYLKNYILFKNCINKVTNNYLNNIYAKLNSNNIIK